MAICAFTHDFSMYGVTPVENYFIEEFMLRAPGDYVKVYLYGLKLCYHPDDSATLPSMARQLGLDEDAVADAYRYWERQGILKRVADNPPRYEYLSLMQSMLARAQDDDGLYQYRDFNHALQQLFGADRLLHPAEYQKVYDWVEVYRLPQDVVLELIGSHIALKGKHFKFQTLDKTAHVWAEKGVRTMAEAKELTRHATAEYQTSKKVLAQLGMRRDPTLDEIELARKWTHDWGFTLEALLTACAQTTKGRNPSFAYLDGILKRYSESGANTAEAVSSMGSAERDLTLAVREVNAELGLRAVSAAPETVAAYQGFLDMGFSHEVILTAAKLAIKRYGKPTWEQLEALMPKWQSLGLTSIEAVDAYLKNQRELTASAQRVLEAAGLERRVEASDRAQLTKWRAMSLPEPLILHAARMAQGTARPLTYMNKLLSDWSAAGIDSVDAAMREGEARRAGGSAGGLSAGMAGSGNAGGADFAGGASGIAGAGSPSGSGGFPGASSSAQSSHPSPRKGLSKEVAEQRYAQRQYGEHDLDYLYVDLESVELDGDT